MNGKERRNKIIEILSSSGKAVSGGTLSEMLEVSRQIIVQDIALLRANNYEILSTNTGYLLIQDTTISRVFKVKHTEAEAQEELNIYVDYGGAVKDVFIFHRAYGTVRADMDIRSRADVIRFCEDIKNSKSSMLMNVTSGYHYHTVVAESEEVLDMIQEKLQEAGFLTDLKEYEPVDF